MKQIHSIQRASLIAVVVNFILALLKIIIGFISGSFAVIADGFDSSFDVIASLITYFTAKYIAKPADATYPYGHHRADPLIARLLAFFVLFIGAQLLLTTIKKFINQETLVVPSILAIVVTIVSIISKIILSRYLHHEGKQTKSSMLIANAKNITGDILISTSVLIGLIGSIFFKMPLIDLLFGFLVALWVIKTAIGIITESNIELMDGMHNTVMYYKIFKAVEEVKGAYNPHKVRMRKLGNQFVIDLDIEVDGKKTISQGHRIANAVEKNIRKHVNDIYDIMVHIEPKGAGKHKEKYGLSRENISSRKKH